MLAAAVATRKQAKHQDSIPPKSCTSMLLPESRAAHYIHICLQDAQPPCKSRSRVHGDHIVSAIHVARSDSDPALPGFTSSLPRKKREGDPGLPHWLSRLCLVCGQPCQPLRNDSISGFATSTLEMSSEKPRMGQCLAHSYSLGWACTWPLA